MAHAQRRRGKASRLAPPPATFNPRGGRYAPLSPSELSQVISAAFDILERIGLASPCAWMTELAVSSGARLRDDGRVCFPRGLVEDAVASACKRVELPGFGEEHGIEIGGSRVHMGTGGAAVSIYDADTEQFRDSTLNDLYELMWIAGRCANIHYGLRPVIARDVADPLSADINTAFAAMKATAKPIGTSFSDAAHVAPVVEMFDTALGPAKRFARQPFCFASICHVVPPLRFAEDACDVLRACIAHRMPVQICSAGQAGATSPASLAGSLAQGLAESLAGLVAVNLMSPGFPCILALMPFIADLRTGAMSGGSGEAAVASAAAAQLLHHLELPSTVFAGITDAKTPDAQAGYEKGYTIALAAQAGADMINLSVGMLGSIMAASKEALVIDDDMCAAVLRSVRGVEIGPDTFDIAQFETVVAGEGHYLGQPQTVALMKSEYVYPQLADRMSIDEWIASDARTVWTKAREKVAKLLTEEPPSHLDRNAEKAIRAAFPIVLDR